MKSKSNYTKNQKMHINTSFLINEEKSSKKRIYLYLMIINLLISILILSGFILFLINTQRVQINSLLTVFPVFLGVFFSLISLITIDFLNKRKMNNISTNEDKLIIKKSIFHETLRFIQKWILLETIIKIDSINLDTNDKNETLSIQIENLIKEKRINKTNKVEIVTLLTMRNKIIHENKIYSIEELLDAINNIEKLSKLLTK